MFLLLFSFCSLTNSCNVLILVIYNNLSPSLSGIMYSYPPPPLLPPSSLPLCHLVPPPRFPPSTVPLTGWRDRVRTAGPVPRRFQNGTTQCQQGGCGLKYRLSGSVYGWYTTGAVALQEEKNCFRVLPCCSVPWSGRGLIVDSDLCV